MNITVKGLIKTVAVGVIAYGAGKWSTLARFAMACKNRPDDVKEAVDNACGVWQILEELTQKEGDINHEPEEQPAPEIVQVTSAAEEDTPENQPED